LIVEKKDSFKKKLKEVLLNEMERKADYRFKIELLGNRDELFAYNVVSPEMVFINLDLIEGEFGEIDLPDFVAETIFVLLVSDEGGAKIKKSIETLKNHGHYFIEEFFLIDNYSTKILQLFCRDLIDKMITKRHNNRK
jgi:hypothetical protein